MSVSGSLFWSGQQARRLTWSMPALALAMAPCLASPSALAESRGYAISMVHTATYADKGNCPQGGNGSTTEIHVKILMDQGYTRAQAVKMLTGHERALDFDQRGHLYGQVVDVGDFPNSVPDDHIQTAQGRYMYGFNLAGKATPYSFEDPETHQVVQDQMWRVLGCFTAYQYKSQKIPPYNEGIAWDTAMDSMPAWLITVSGTDLSHDGDVTVTFDRSLDILMRNAHGGVLAGSSYTVDPDPRNHSVFKGHIKDHVITIEPGNFFMQGESQFYALLRLTNTHLRLKMNADGSLQGFIGGYQPWLDYYHYVSIRGEEDSEVDIPGVYYALKRLADAIPDPVTGQNTAISATYYLEAVPAYTLARDGKVMGTAYVDGQPLDGVAR